MADNLGPALLIQKIEKVGGFAILAHADNNKGFLHEFCEGTTHDCDLKFTGKSLAKIIKSTGLLGIQCNSDANKEKLKFKLCNKDYTREGSPLAYICLLYTSAFEIALLVQHLQRTQQKIAGVLPKGKAVAAAGQ